MKKTAAVLIGIAMLALAGCSSSAPASTTSYEDATALAAAYTDAGGQCASPTAYDTLPGSDTALCEDGITISKLDESNAKQLHDELDAIQMPDGYSLIAGSDWTVFGPINSPDAVAKSMGGELLIAGR